MKPCPFCGSTQIETALLQRGDGPYEYSANCEGCDANGPIRSTRSEAIEAWNERSDHAG